MSTISLKQTIRREILARQDIIGTVIGLKRLIFFAGSGSTAETWVTDVDIGANRFLVDVPIKASPSNGSRYYADLGATVLCRRNTQGRYEVIGPGDKVAGTLVISEYDLVSDVATSTANQGFSFERVPFEHYQGTGPPNSLWNDGLTSFPLVRKLDGDGNPI